MKYRKVVGPLFFLIGLLTFGISLTQRPLFSEGSGISIYLLFLGLILAAFGYMIMTNTMEEE